MIQPLILYRNDRMKYAEVIMSVSHKDIDRVFHYIIPDEMKDALTVGMRVLAQFGRGNKEIEGYVIGFTDETDVPLEKMKPLIKIMDGFPLLSPEMIELAKWMKEKYYTTLSDCLTCIIPKIVSLRCAPEPMATTDTMKKPPTPEQRQAIEFIINDMDRADKKPILIHGVTGSGKTEIYLQAIEEAVKRGMQAIVLVPEISLTPQTVETFTGRFGNMAAVTHSRLSLGERYDRWKKALNCEISIMIGPRSAIFTPFKNLGIIIVDEEHEATYKSETTPKYDVKEVSGKLQEIFGCTVVFASATPSVSTYYSALSGHMELIELKERVNKKFPDVNIIDMRTELAQGNKSIFGEQLLKDIEANIAKKEQTILFLNRRGHSTFVSCRKCGYVMKCEDCNVNYTYHLHTDKLSCHYCGKQLKNPETCPACSSKYIKYFGVGTQKVEDEIIRIFPGAGVLRMDMDTTKNKGSHQAILKRFAKGKADILIGTQMIAKGLDFPNVSLVGIIAADLSLNTGDFRVAETTFQLLTQVSGRAGRAAAYGKVYIQTYNPEHYSIVYSKDNNYKEFYNHEITLRRSMTYPPFSNIFFIMFTGSDERKIIVKLHTLLNIMNHFNRKGLFEFLGPAPAIISKVKKQYRWKLIVKGLEEERLRNFVIYCVDKFKEKEETTGITVSLTLNPTLIL